jgi:hypothetical protein
MRSRQVAGSHPKGGPPLAEIPVIGSKISTLAGKVMRSRQVAGSHPKGGPPLAEIPVIGSKKIYLPKK